MRSRRPRRRSLPPPTPLPAGARVGGWEIRHVLGRGAHAIVYLAVADDGELEVAVKEYLPSALAVRSGALAVVPRSPADAEAYAAGLRAVLDEARALAPLEHPSLVAVQEFWEQNGTAYVAMDLVVGRSLLVTHQTRGRSPREPVLRQMLGTLIDAVEVLHAAGMQHADIAPQSIIVQPNGRPVLMDPGSARWVLGDAGETAAGPRDGYAPIELYRGTGGARGPWTDIYALGAVVHHLIAGRPPAPAPRREPADRVAARLHQADERFSFDFLGVVDWMLAPLPAARPQSLAQLRAALAGDTLPAPYRPTRRMRLAAALARRKRALLVTLLVLVLLVTAGAVLVIMARSGRLPWLLR